jgi:hypothetical protein
MIKQIISPSSTLIYFQLMDEHHNPWQIIDQHEAYDNNWITVTHYDVINPSGNKGIYGKVHMKNVAIGVVPLDDDMNTYLVGQYRFVIDEYSWEIPEGGAPLNDQPLASAQRELLEETGLKAQAWTQRPYRIPLQTNDVLYSWQENYRNILPCPKRQNNWW